jgi:hypothetical protein
MEGVLFFFTEYNNGGGGLQFIFQLIPANFASIVLEGALTILINE